MSAFSRIRFGALLVGGVIMVAPTPQAAAQTANLRRDILESQRRLEAVRAERARLQREMGDLTNRVRNVSGELLNIERQLSASRSALAEVEFQAEATTVQIEESSRSLIQARERLSEGTAILQRRLRDIYKRGPESMGLMLSVAGYAGSTAVAATMTFEPGTVSLGTAYGLEFGHSAGELVLVERGIVMSVRKFRLRSFVALKTARIMGPRPDRFPTHVLDLDNISVHFDFSRLAFEATLITIEFCQYGGNVNIAVNGETLHQLGRVEDLPRQVAQGVTATIGDGVITLTGAVTDLLVGGQELSIDNVTAVSECILSALGGDLDAGDSAIEDCNHNGIPDECTPGDVDGDETVGLPDHVKFTQCLAGPCAAPPCSGSSGSAGCCSIVDFDNSESVDLRDVAAFQRVFDGP
ncbi:MAG: hypothetical protein IH968_02395 [Gemmatimonadetes bacterium]|nr:hypothetical protein [Gemmatimonadota bacterium]